KEQQSRVTIFPTRALQTQTQVSPRTRRRFSLSQRERAGVRESLRITRHLRLHGKCRGSDLLKSAPAASPPRAGVHNAKAFSRVAPNRAAPPASGSADKFSLRRACAESPLARLPASGRVRIRARIDAWFVRASVFP